MLASIDCLFVCILLTFSFLHKHLVNKTCLLQLLILLKYSTHQKFPKHLDLVPHLHPLVMLTSCKKWLLLYVGSHTLMSEPCTCLASIRPLEPCVRPEHISIPTLFLLIRCSHLCQRDWFLLVKGTDLVLCRKFYNCLSLLFHQRKVKVRATVK